MRGRGRKPARADFIEPCLALAVPTPPEGKGWVHEIKYDGYRIQAHLKNRRATLYSRRGIDWTHRMGVVVAELEALGVKSAIIDCEAIVQGQGGVADFPLLLDELERGRFARILLMAFDVMELDGQDLRNEPLLERKAALKRMLGKRAAASLLQFSDHMQGSGGEVLKSACKLGLEGIVSKQVHSAYRSGRRGDWVKIKCLLADPFVVIGYVDSKAARGMIGSLVLGYYEGRSLLYAGRVGTGFSQRQAVDIWRRLQPLRQAKAPIAKQLTREQLAGVKWVRPRFVAQVEYRAWTADGILRHSAFKAFREDKAPTEIQRPHRGRPTR